MYSAFGVDHHGAEISKKVLPFGSKGGKLASAKVHLRGLTQSGTDQLRTAAQRTITNPKNKDVPLRGAGKPFVDELSDASPAHGAIETGRRLAPQVKADKAAGKSVKDSVLDRATLGDLNQASTVRRVDESPSNIFRGKKTTTTDTNLITGQTKKHVKREGNKFFKPKDMAYVNGESIVGQNKQTGGLTDAGKVTLVGGPAAAAGLGGIALNEKAKRSSY
jgi:hypothetical protein